MVRKTSPAGGIFLTAAQSMQGFQQEMRLIEQVNREANRPEATEDPGTMTLQQAPAAEPNHNQA